VRIANDVQEAGRSYTGDVCNVINELPSDALLPEVRLDKQGVQLRTTVGPQDQSGKAHNGALALCDTDTARRDLFDWQRDRVRIREEGVAIARIAERCATLQ
jgi:hypothetical protein